MEESSYFVVRPPGLVEPVMGSSPPEYVSLTDIRTSVQRLTQEGVQGLLEVGAKVYRNVQFQITDYETTLIPNSKFARYWEGDDVGVALGVGLKDVVERIRAPEAWLKTRGSGVTIIIIDTGIHPNVREIETHRRHQIDLDSAYIGRHWSDDIGHGSMCAVIAAGSTANGGKFDGVAPEASVLAVRSSLKSSDLYRIYDQLITLRKRGAFPGPVVISNSFAQYQCAPDGLLPKDHPYAGIVIAAIEAGFHVVFSAGNNHHNVHCNHDPAMCAPNSIWGLNSHDEILCVGTVDASGSNTTLPSPHVNSSRGPGEWAKLFPKPDCVAPTYGEVAWGGGYKSLDWWGSSGACPQAAGLVALMLSVNPKLQPAEVNEIVRASCQPLDGTALCVGAGMIDCQSAVEMAVRAV